MISVCVVQVDDFIGGFTECIDVFLTDKLGNFNIGTIICTKCDCTIQHELHITCTGCFLGSKRNLFGNIGSRDSKFSLGNVVVFNHDNLEIPGYFRIVIDQLTQTQNGMNNTLCLIVGWSCLTTEYNRNRTGWDVACFDLKVFVDDIQNIHLLTFVFMHSLDLNIDDGIRIDIDVLAFLHILSKADLVIVFDFIQTIQEPFVIVMVKQSFQLVCILSPFCTDHLIKQGCKSRVAVHDPSSECDAVGLVVELGWIDIIEWLEFLIFEDFRMQRSYPVNGVAEVHIHTCHVNSVVMVNNCKVRIAMVCSGYNVIQTFNDRHQLWYNFQHVVQWPLFQSFCQNRMVCIATYIGYDHGGFLECDAFIDQ